MNKLALMAVLGTVMAGCAASAEPDPYDVLSHRDPEDPSRETLAPDYRSVLAGYQPRSVVEPKSWSDTATPAEKTDGEQQ